MQDFQQRVVDEKDALFENLGKLQLFMTTDIYRKLPMMERARLDKQEWLMRGYLEILHERINAF